ncbi:superoxide dismutase [Desarmillaria tabescens]|uniref:Superoxide dismutase [Cu-Zn] n=1 Tax=Armillaria tabescens TaxID=1929756 RepID=A0AA39K456_ARMTA|nr:superoxide dismutase [Desarmillaria tabescens]KAK0454251.1 superoxide dismutase [Desarmillaria tabescens]
MMFKALFLALAVALPVWSWDVLVTEAVVVLSGPSTVNGTVIFQQSSSDGPVHVTGRIQGLDPSALRGFHVHTSGNLTNGCTSAGAHFNPLNTTHGAPTDPINARHVGDLGNIQSDASGVAILDITDEIISLNGPLSIVGRSIVVHTGTDDLGRGGTNLSSTTGNSGERAACGVIGLS